VVEKTGAEIVVESLVKEKVKHIFGIPGGVLLPIFDKLYGSPIRVILSRHEQGASHMADGYSRSTGKVGVCIATSGPGATNLTTGLATAHLDSIPVVAITGQVATHLIGNDAFQEADATGITRSVTKHNYLVKDVKELAGVIKEAFYIAASGRPGPVHIDIPVDVQRAKTEFIWPQDHSIRSYKPNYQGHPLQIKRAAELIAKSEKPLLYVGGGVVSSGAYEELKRLAERADIPVIVTLMANGTFPHEHKLYVGYVGMHGKYSANMAMQKCDCLISCGARFDDRVTGNLSSFSPNSKKIHIDIDPTSIGKNVPVDVPVVGDVKQVLSVLVEHISKKEHKKWIKQINEWERLHPLSYGKTKEGYPKPQYVIQTLHKITKGAAVVVTGVGQHQMWSMQWYPTSYPRHFLSSGGLGTMGYGFPASVGAKMANPNKEVVCIDGDGSFQMTMTEMATVVREKVKVIVIVLNNGFLGMVRQWQDMFYGKRYSYTCFAAAGGTVPAGYEYDHAKQKYVPDFMKFADAYGVKGIRITKSKEVEPGLKKAIASKGPVLVEVLTPPEENVFPMVPAGAPLDEVIIDMA